MTAVSMFIARIEQLAVAGQFNEITVLLRPITEARSEWVRKVTQRLLNEAIQKNISDDEYALRLARIELFANHGAIFDPKALLSIVEAAERQHAKSVRILQTLASAWGTTTDPIKHQTRADLAAISVSKALLLREASAISNDEEDLETSAKRWQKILNRIHHIFYCHGAILTDARILSYERMLAHWAQSLEQHRVQILSVEFLLARTGFNEAQKTSLFFKFIFSNLVPNELLSILRDETSNDTASILWQRLYQTECLYLAPLISPQHAWIEQQIDTLPRSVMIGALQHVNQYTPETPESV